LFAKTNNDYVLQEFIWLRQIALNEHPSKLYANPTSCIEINQGNHIYLTEIDVNDAQNGIIVDNNVVDRNNAIHDIFMDKIAVVRCNKGFVFKASNYYINRIKVSDSSIFLKNADCCMAFEFLRKNEFNISDSVFDTIYIDKEGGSGHFSINDPDTGVINCRFLNFRLPPNQFYDCTLKVSNLNNELNFTNVKKSDTTSNYSTSGLVYTITLATNSPFPANPVAIVSTNQKNPFKITTTNTPGGVSQLHVEFLNAPTGSVVISYSLTGFYHIL